MPGRVPPPSPRSARRCGGVSSSGGVAALELRPFAPDDDAQLMSWFADAAELRRFAGPSLHWPLNSEQLHTVRATPALSAFSAISSANSARVCGHIEVVLIGRASRARLARVALAPECRGKGLGRSLVELGLEQARLRGVREVELFVFVDNGPARRVYESLGFRQHGTDPHDSTSLAMALGL